MNYQYGAVSLSWDGYDYNDKNFKVYKSANNGSTWQTVGIDYTLVDRIDCLQIYPIDAAKNQLKEWVEDGGYGKGIIHIDTVYIEDFNNDPEAYMKDPSTGEWKYDVIFFGTWDVNADQDISETARDLVVEYIGTGRGCILGHDCLRSSAKTSIVNHPYFNSLQSYFGLETSREKYSYLDITNTGSTYVKIVKNGLFTKYPNYIGEVGTILEIPLSHIQMSKVINPNTDIWLVFTNTLYEYSNEELAFLSTNNNCANILTGHSKGAATPDEQKIIANLIFYCNQLSFNQSGTVDASAMDTEVPNKPTITYASSTGKAQFSSTDNGSKYYYYVESYDKNDTTSTGLLARSSTKNLTVTTGIQGYRYIFDNNTDTEVTLNNGTYTTSTSITTSESYEYIHVAAIDKANNISETTHLYLNPQYTISYKKGDSTFTGTLPSKTTATYNKDVTLNTYGIMKGTQYKIQFNTNTDHANDTGKTNGTATTSTTSTSSRVTGIDNRTGNLTFNKWKITQADDTSNHVGNTYDSGETITKPNFTNKLNGTVTATAQWNSKEEKDYGLATLPGYQFQGWYDSESGGNKIESLTITPSTTKYEKTLYAHWEPNTYKIEFNGNGNWNSNTSWDDNTNYKGKYTQILTFDNTNQLRNNEYTRNTGDTNSKTWCPYELQKGYTFIGWDTNKNRNDGSADFTNKQSAIFNLTETNNSTLKYYAIWEKDITLTFDYNGGTGLGGGTQKKLTYTLYNSEYQHKFDISNMYGTHDDNGMNTQFTKMDSDGRVYRFLGWSTDKNATQPDTRLGVYDSNRLTNYTIHDDTTLYAVWEEALLANITLQRSIGDLNFINSSGSATNKPRTTAYNVTAETNDLYTDPFTGTEVISKQNVANIGQLTNNTYVETILKPGEQGSYTIQTLNKGALVKVAFDSRITDIYTHNGLWTDELNPNGTGEELKTTQKHGLDRKFTTSNIAETRKFYIPQYLGTDQSYSTSNPSKGATGTNIYYITINISKPSVYWQNVYGKNEEITVTGVIYLSPNQDTIEGTGTGAAPLTILEELRTRLQIRIL